MFAAQSLSHLDRQSLAAEDVDQRQRAELFTIAQLVVDEVEALWLRVQIGTPSDESDLLIWR